MVNNGHGMRDTMVPVTGPWEAELKDERGAIPVAWNWDSDSHGRTLPIVGVEAK